MVRYQDKNKHYLQERLNVRFQKSKLKLIVHYFLRVSFCHLDNCVEEAHSEDDLPPVPAEGVFLKEVVGDLGEGSPDVGSQAFGRFIRYLVARHKAEIKQAVRESKAYRVISLVFSSTS